MIMRKLLLTVVLLVIAVTLLTAGNSSPVRLKGIVLYNRTAPALESPAVTRNRAVCGDRVPNETLLIHPKGGLQNVLVFIANVAPESLATLQLSLETRGCRFQPHVVALGVGSQLTVRNGDPMLHNVHARLHEFETGWDKTSTLQIFTNRAETYFNFAFPAQNNTAVQKMDKPGLIRLRSDAGHDWMSGYILVMPHRYFAVTDAEGKFELPELPPERYDLVLWHETLGVKRQIVEAKAGEKNELVIKWFPEEAASAADTAKAN
jgi:hypothetical protein